MDFLAFSSALSDLDLDPGEFSSVRRLGLGGNPLWLLAPAVSFTSFAPTRGPWELLGLEVDPIFLRWAALAWALGPAVAALLHYLEERPIVHDRDPLNLAAFALTCGFISATFGLFAAFTPPGVTPAPSRAALVSLAGMAAFIVTWLVVITTAMYAPGTQAQQFIRKTLDQRRGYPALVLLSAWALRNVLVPGWGPVLVDLAMATFALVEVARLPFREGDRLKPLGTALASIANSLVPVGLAALLGLLALLRAIDFIDPLWILGLRAYLSALAADTLLWHMARALMGAFICLTLALCGLHLRGSNLVFEGLGWTTYCSPLAAALIVILVVPGAGRLVGDIIGVPPIAALGAPNARDIRLLASIATLTSLRAAVGALGLAQFLRASFMHKEFAPGLVVVGAALISVALLGIVVGPLWLPAAARELPALGASRDFMWARLGLADQALLGWPWRPFGPLGVLGALLFGPLWAC